MKASTNGAVFAFALAILIATTCPPASGAKSSSFSDMKKKVATVALFGLAGAGVGVLTVAASSDHQSRVSNIQAGLVIGAVVGTVYVLSTDDEGYPKSALWIQPGIRQKTSLGLAYRF